ncbi:MAG TPA: MBL fold metallo-hydrolase [Gemmatimonadales bacterium]|nr:MBL fold metallo-hydrolase [Gemmatimonadales bacterium]
MSYTLTFWGTRGSIPTPGPGTARFGGNTPCVGLANGADRLVVLDAGTGLRPLGNSLMRDGRPSDVDLLLSHTHWDHIQGFPFFKPLSVPGTCVRIYGAAQEGVSLASILHRQMDPMVFPVPLTALAAQLSIKEIGEEAFEVGDFAVQTFCLRHPGTTLGYRLRPMGGGREVAYLTDNELGPGGRYPVPRDWRRRLVKFLGGTDTLIHDAMYSEGIVRARAGWGHSTPRQAVDLAAEAGCRRLVLFHHDPEHDDAALEALLSDAQAFAAERAPSLEVAPAREGDQLVL